MRDRASVGGLRYYSYGFVCLSMPNLLHVFICYKTEKGTLTLLSFIRVTLRVLALLGQVTWTETVLIRGGFWGGDATTGIWAANTPLRGIDGCEGASLKGGGGAPGPQHIWLKMTALSR